MQMAVRRVTREERGFTLIELLVVIIVIAVLAAIAIPTFLGQREKANDSAAYTLVRNALTAVQTAFVDTSDYSAITVDQLREIEPTIHWVAASDDLVGTSPAFIADPTGADAKDNEVAFYGQSKTILDVASTSASGNRFGIQVNTVDLTSTGYVKVRVIEEQTTVGW
jgi:type IV pilus assembly protein PilA